MLKNKFSYIFVVLMFFIIAIYPTAASVSAAADTNTAPAQMKDRGLK